MSRRCVHLCTFVTQLPTHFTQLDCAAVVLTNKRSFNFPSRPVFGVVTMHEGSRESK